MTTIRAALCLAWTTALGLPSAAQEARQAEPALVLKTADTDVAMRFAWKFGHGDQAATLPAGSHWVATLAADRSLALTTASGDVRFLELWASPPRLLQTFADEIGQVLGMVRGAMVMAMQQQGIPPKEAMTLVQSILDFPKQLESATLVLARDPRNLAEAGLDVDIGITGAEGSAFARSVGALRPSSSGPPKLPGGPEPLMELSMAVDPAAMLDAFAPFLDLGLSFSYADPKARQAAMAMSARMLKLFDGGFAMSIGDDVSMSMLAGLTDTAATQELLGSEEYLAMARGQQMANRHVEIEVTPGALEHRGATFVRTHVTNDGPPNPMMPDGEMSTFTAAVGGYMVMGGSEAIARRLADAVVERRVGRGPLAGGALARMRLNLPRAVEAFAPIAPESEEMPEHLDVEIGAQGRTLMVRAHVR